ncbi:MAG: tetratricopeptide repeat protein [Endomicrobium sp.]|nr:tetratricopeptide repeat protein [Endomicrobium sp.]
MELGKFYFLNNNYDEAVAEFNKALDINKDNPEAYYNLGLISESSNRPQDAKEMYLKALSIKPDFKIAREKLNKLMGLNDE